MRSHILAAVIAIQMTPAHAETITSLTLDWNGDGFADIATLDASRNFEDRADLLLYEGTAAGPGSNLVLTAPDFARRATHPNMLLQIVRGTAPNRFEVIETGTLVDPSFWWAKTRVRHDGTSFFVDGRETQQTPPIYQDDQLFCLLDFTDKSMGGGGDAMSEIIPLDMNPIPLSDWTSSTFADLLNDTFQVCTPLQSTYQSFIDTGNTINDEIAYDWNNDGHTDKLILFDSYSNPSVLAFMGDGTGKAHLTWIARNLGLPRGEELDLRVAPGRRGVIEVSIFGKDDDDGRARVDTVTKLIWLNDEPIVSGFAVWQTYGDSQTGIDCTWDFRRGQQINVYVDKWFDDIDYPDPYPLAAWEDVVLGDIIGECRP